jgi:hypothetical protein
MTPLLPLASLFCGILFDAATLVYPPLSLGAPDELKMRLFRLTRVGAVALPLLAILFSGLAARAGDRRARRADIALRFGALTMPIVLAAAVFARIEFRTLLPLPALAVVYGLNRAASIARQRVDVPELWGWRLVAASAAAGLMMGLYAFDAPLLGDFAGAYDGPLRAAVRAAHESAMVAGMALIVGSRACATKGAADEDRSYRRRRRQTADA